MKVLPPPSGLPVGCTIAPFRPPIAPLGAQRWTKGWKLGKLWYCNQLRVYVHPAGVRLSGDSAVAIRRGEVEDYAEDSRQPTLENIRLGAVQDSGGGLRLGPVLQQVPAEPFLYAKVVG